MTVACRNAAAVPGKSCSTTSVTPVLPGTSLVLAAVPAVTPLRTNVSLTVKYGSVSSCGASSNVNVGRKVRSAVPCT